MGERKRKGRERESQGWENAEAASHTDEEFFENEIERIFHSILVQIETKDIKREMSGWWWGRMGQSWEVIKTREREKKVERERG